MRILTYTNLYPSVARPVHGLFVEQRLKRLAALADIESRVVAPVPWYPAGLPAVGPFASYAPYRSAPRREVREGIEVLYPRYPVIPKVGMALAPTLMAAATARVLTRIRAGGFPFDLIDAHFFYPDGLAALALGKRFGVPVVITARGTDVHTYQKLPAIWRRTVRAARECAAVIAVCEALRTPLLEAGVPAEKVVTLRNGVDLERFTPLDRQTCRAELGLSRPTLLSVGSLRAVKGHDLTIRALAKLPEYELLIVGEGEERARLTALIESLHLSDRAKLVGNVANENLGRYYSAADAMVLASSREGWANVLLESMACGTPAVAARLWGTPEVVREPEAGELMNERTPEALAEAVRVLAARAPSHASTRRYAEGFSWEDTVARQAELYRRAIRGDSVSTVADSPTLVG